MFMIVVLTVHMYMVMLDRLMDMKVVMMFSKQEQNSHCHNQGSKYLIDSPCVTQNRHSSYRANKWGCGKESRFPRGSQ